jgi:hypothetical protein
MYKLFELGILRKDEPYELVFTDDFNDAVANTHVQFEISGYPSWWKYIRRCVANFFWGEGKHDVDEGSELVGEITDIIFKLQKAGLLENVQKNVTEEDRKRTDERVEQEREKIVKAGMESF